jgi:hypothetical protein
MTRARVAAAVLIIAASTAVAAGQGGPDAKMKTVDTKLGFTIDVPEAWTVSPPSENNKFEVGSGDEDFALVVTDFPALPDAAEADALYKESFASTGFKLKSSSDVKVSGKTVKRYVFSMDAETGEGHVEVVMLPVGDAVYSVLVATPAAALAARQAVIAKMFDSIVLK